MDVSGNAMIRDFMDKLTATTNVSKYVELPMIAVMGDTSSGKSSLLSSISLVELPSNSNLTTRCPTMLKMSKSDVKRATVSVQWRQKPDGSDEEINFPETDVSESEWATLPNVIEKAQAHIIKCTGKEVARDVVHVNVYAPNCHDLTLIDLPGIVRSRGENEGATLVEDINGLIEDYLGNKRCVILAVVPANVDFHNSEIMANAKKVDPETLRTIPVITKPDLIDVGGENDVLSLLCGQKIKFELGFHMVKGRGQKALDMKTSIEDGLLAESSFFDNTKPWRDVANREMLGTTHLRTKLGELQMKMIRDTIPDIVQDMRKKKVAAENELQTMGQVLNNPSDRLQYFRNHIHVFLNELRSSLSGSNFNGKDEPASAKLHKAAGEFKTRIAKGRLANVSKIFAGSEVLLMLDDGKEVACKVLRIEHDSEGKVWFTLDYEPDEDKHPQNRVRGNPNWLMDLIINKRTQTLPCFLNEEVFRAIANEMMNEDCIPHCQALQEEALLILNETIDHCLVVSGIPQRYDSLGLMVQERAKRAVVHSIGKERLRLKDYLEEEMYPYSQNHYLFENLSKRRNSTLKQELLLALDGVKLYATYHNNPNEHAKAIEKQKVAIETVVSSVFERNQKKSVDEHVAQEMEAVLDSYGKVAMKRIVDLVPMGCWRSFRTVQDNIRTCFDEITESELVLHMQDSRSFRQRHHELKLEQEELRKGLELFASIL